MNSADCEHDFQYLAEDDHLTRKVHFMSILNNIFEKINPKRFSVVIEPKSVGMQAQKASASVQKYLECWHKIIADFAFILFH